MPESAPGGSTAAADPRVVAVVVTYEPEVRATAALLRALRPQVTEVVVVDNGSRAELVDALATQAGSIGAELVRLDRNVGIGAAQNVGIDRARSLGAELVLLSDQDSLPAPDMVGRLLDGLVRARAEGLRVGAVGPVTVDDRASGAALLFDAQRWGPRRASIPDTEGELVPAAFLLASGCLVPLSVLDDVGAMNEPWFIDHVDLEWGLRAGRRGYRLFGVTGAELAHSLGDRTVQLPGRRRRLHIHSPVRNYYMVRNTLHLVRSGLMPVAWRVGYVVWILKYTAYYALAQAPRGRRLALMARAAVHGMMGRSGPLSGTRA